jgi:hypothetical protein
VSEDNKIIEDNRVWKVQSLQDAPFVVFSGPSAGGKTTTSELVARHIDGSSLLVKHTNRPMRPGEVTGVDYHFVEDNRCCVAVPKSKFRRSCFKFHVLIPALKIILQF